MATDTKTAAADSRIPKDLQERRKRQRQALVQAQQKTEAERSTEEQAQNLLSSEALGVAKVQDQPIAMPFIRGQAAGVRRQTQAQLEPLQRRLSRLQAERQQKANVAETQLGFAREDVQTERAQQRKQAEQKRQSLKERQENIRAIAEDARQRGAGQAEVAAILAAETPEQAQQAAASVAPVQPEVDERFETRSISGGGILEIEKDPATGEVVNTRVVRQPQRSDDTEEGLTDTVIRETARELNATRGQDGFVNTSDYVATYNEWLRQGGTPEGFKEQFPPQAYIDVNDDTLPDILRSDDGGSDNPFQ